MNIVYGLIWGGLSLWGAITLENNGWSLLAIIAFVFSGLCFSQSLFQLWILIKIASTQSDSTKPTSRTAQPSYKPPKPIFSAKYVSPEVKVNSAPKDDGNWNSAIIVLGIVGLGLLIVLTSYYSDDEVSEASTENLPESESNSLPPTNSSTSAVVNVLNWEKQELQITNTGEPTASWISSIKLCQGGTTSCESWDASNCNWDNLPNLLDTTYPFAQLAPGQTSSAIVFDTDDEADCYVLEILDENGVDISYSSKTKD